MLRTLIIIIIIIIRVENLILLKFGIKIKLEKRDFIIVELIIKVFHRYLFESV